MLKVLFHNKDRRGDGGYAGGGGGYFVAFGLMYIKRSKYLVQFSSVECKEWRADDISTSHGRSIKTLSN